MTWAGTNKIESKSFRCGYCGNVVASADGYYKDGPSYFIRICPHCELPSFFDNKNQIPGVVPGNEVSNLPEQVATL